MPAQDELESKIRQLEENGKRLEDELSYYRSIFDYSDYDFWQMDLTGNISFVSPAKEKIFGYSREESLEMNFRSFLEEKEIPPAMETIKAVVSSRTARTVEVMARKKDHAVFPVEVSVWPVLKDGEVIGIHGITRDISKRKESEAALTSRNKFIETILENLPIGLAVNRISDGVVTYVNKKFAEIYGWSPAEVPDIATFFRKTYPDPGYRMELQERIMADIASGDLSRMKWNGMEITTSNGDKKIVKAENFPIFEQDLMISTVQDETELKKIENRLQQARKMESIATLAGGIAHLFNNALSVINGYVGMIKLDFHGMEPIGQYIAPMEKSVQKMTRFTDLLLSYARGGKYQPQKIILNHLIEDTLPLLEKMLNSSIELETGLFCDDIEIEVDETQIQVVLSALLANAAEAINGQGHIRINCSIEIIENPAPIAKDVPVLPEGKYAVITVSDDGEGMEEEVKTRIFEPFFTTKSQGRGLGMAAVYGIVKNHGGWIVVQSEKGMGTTVRIYLPSVI